MKEWIALFHLTKKASTFEKMDVREHETTDYFKY